MKSHKQNIGIGNYHINKATEARWKIFIALSDGQWHRNMKLKEKTELSSRTLAKHLSQMTKIRIIERKKDVKSGKYPIPVLYKIKFPFDTYVKANISRIWFANQIETMLDETKDPLFILDAIHVFSQEGFIGLLRIIQQDKSITNEELYFLGECFLWTNYKKFISKLIEASRQIINNLNITQLLMNQAKRQIKIYETALQIYEKTEKINQQS